MGTFRYYRSKGSKIIIGRGGVEAYDKDELGLDLAV